MTAAQVGAERRARLARSRLYLVCGARPRVETLLASAIAGGVDVVQLREKTASEEGLLAHAATFRRECSRLGVLLFVNDNPEVALRASADGVHVGQQDMPVEEVRELVGEELLIGLSTHSPAEIDAVDASLVDYIGVGPVHATPTKPGRPAVGVELIRYAAAHAPVPFFAIGGLDAANLDEALAAGASRACVLRALADARDPRAAARALRERLEAGGR